MPREIVRSHLHYSWPVSKDDPTPAADMGISVGWGRDNPVEIDTCLIYADGPRAEHVILPLDRAGVNALIRVLRKARDGSFGADA